MRDQLNYREILERLADALIVADEANRIVYANAACEALLGWPSGALVGQSLGVIQPTRMHAQHLAGFERYLRTREPTILGKPIRVPAVRRDGAEITLELTLSTQQIGDGKELIVGSLRDLRERVELEHQRAARSEAELRASRAEFLDQAGRELASSLDYVATLTRITRLAVATMADWCVVDIVDEAGTLQRLAVTHKDSAKEAIGDDLARRYPPAEHAVAGATRVARTGQAECVAEIDDDLLASIAQDEEHLRLLRGLGLVSYLCVPLKARDHTLGVLTCVTGESGHRYGSEDLLLLEGLARHAGQAIDNARLFGGLESEVAKRKQRETRLARVSRLYALHAEMIQAVVRAPDRMHLFADICRIVVETSGFRMAWVGLVDFDAELVQPVAHHGAGAEAYLAELELSWDQNGPTSRALRDGQPAICNDIANEPQMQPWSEQALAHGYRASAALPLCLQGQVIGTFNVYAGEGGFFDAEGIRLFAEAAENISYALDALDRERRRHKAEDALRAERAFLVIALQNIKDGLVACDAQGAITLFNRAARDFYGQHLQAALPENWRDQFQLLEADGITPLETTHVPLYRALAGEAIQDVEMVIVPKNGERRVVVCNGQALYDSAARKVGAVVTMHDITARKQAETRLVRMAFYDPLTGLPNRRLLMDRLGHALARAKRQPSSLAVLFIDLDRLKVINVPIGDG